MLTLIKVIGGKIDFVEEMWRGTGRLMRKMQKHIIKPSLKRLYGLDLRQEKGRTLMRKALLSYIVHPFSIARHDPRFYRHINIWRACEIVWILNELGYLVDVVDYRDEEFIPDKGYDLFIGHGGFNFETIATHLHEWTIKVYFTTGNYWMFRNREILTRFDELEERRGVELSPDRLQTPGEESALLLAGRVIGIGGAFSRKTYGRFSNVIMMNNTALFDAHYEQHDKDFVRGRDHFLFFAGQGNIHKGLDLLLEAFAELKQHLWICSYIDKEFEEAYQAELYKSSNIHVPGFLEPRSPKFYEMMRVCNYVILPSCSEGQTHSVVESMNQGLIPVVSKACGLDVSQYGEVLHPCTIEEIKNVVLKLAALSPAECSRMSAKANKVAGTDFSEEAFRRNMKNALLRVINVPKPQKCEDVKQQFFRPIFVDEDHKVSYHNDALNQIETKSDIGYLKLEQGVIEVDHKRWDEAQRYERLSWMGDAGLKRHEDRNTTHKIGFENYSAIKGNYFRNVIELGCGPFTNMRHIVKQIRCEKLTLLDPLINDYLTHPHCAYRDKRLGGRFGKKVETVALPMEEFSPEEKFDLVVVINVLEHCFSAPKGFDCILSITAPKGVIVFHEKIISDDMIGALVHRVYDTGHPLRIAESIILSFLDDNYHELFRKQVPVKTTFGTVESVYFIGRRRD